MALSDEMERTFLPRNSTPNGSILIVAMRSMGSIIQKYKLLRQSILVPQMYDNINSRSGLLIYPLDFVLLEGYSLNYSCELF